MQEKKEKIDKKNKHFQCFRKSYLVQSVKNPSLNITFINLNTEEQIVQAMAGVLAYNLAENDDKITFDYKNSSSYQNSHSIEEEEL